MEYPVPWIPIPSFFPLLTITSFIPLCACSSHSPVHLRTETFLPGVSSANSEDREEYLCWGSVKAVACGKQSVMSYTKSRRTLLFYILLFLYLFSEISSHLNEHSHSESSFSKRVVLHFWADFLLSPGLWWHKTDRSNAGCVHTTGGWPRSCGHPRGLPEQLSTPVAWGAGFRQTLCQMICSNSTESVLPDGNHHITALFPWNMHKASWACELYTEAKAL